MSYLSAKHKEDLHNSGLDDKIINEVGFYTCDAAEANKLLDRRDIDCECLVFPYPGVDDFYRLKPDGIILSRDGKPAKYLQKAGTESRLFIHQAVKENLVSQNGTGLLPLLVVEGEKKTLKATQELFFKRNEVLPVGIAGVYNWKKRIVVSTDKGNKQADDFIEDIKNLSVAGRNIYICFDSNIEFNDQVEEAEAELSRRFIGKGARRVLYVRIPHEEEYGKHGLGLDDYICKYGTDEFIKLLRKARSNKSVAYAIKLIRKLPNNSFSDKADKIVSLIIRDLSDAGSFYNDNNGTYYYDNITAIMLQIEEDIFARKLADDYELYRDTNEFKAVVSKIEEHAAIRGKEVIIKNVSYFDVQNQSLFIYNNDGSMLRIRNKEEVSKFNNGQQSIFFKHRHEYAPINYKKNQTGKFDEYILNVCNFQDIEQTRLSANQQRFLFTVWFYSLFFPNLLPTKPILVMTGDYGSGKSTIQRLIGKLLFGGNFNVSTLQGERDFLASVINKYYLVYDNVDITEEWVRNAIASLSTGFKVEVRKLYSNMEMFQADPIAYLAMNSMTQGLYKRPDIASRLLIFRTKRIEGARIPETLLYKNLLEHRDEILSEVFDTLGSIINYIDDRFSYYGNFRLADFANLGFKISTAMGREKEFEIILDILAREQTELPLEDNPIIDVIDKWLNTRLQPEYISTGELYGVLEKTAKDSHLYWPFKSSLSFAKQMQSALENLKLYYSILQRRSHGNKTMWLITYRKD